MQEIDFEKRAMNVLRGATDTGFDAQHTTPIYEVEQNLEEHVQVELDAIWSTQGDKPDEEWNQIKIGIIENIPSALEHIQEDTDFDFYEKRVFEQFDELS